MSTNLFVMNSCFSFFLRLLLAGFFLSVGGVYTEIYAQQTQPATPPSQETSDREQGSLLPEINPRDIEIRSQYQARFPGVTRQPILGFKPRPRIYQIDPNRMPYLETDEEQIVNLPIGILSRPAGPSYTPFALPELRYTTVELGHGSEGSPVGSVWFQAPLGFNPERNITAFDSTAFPWISGTLRLRSLAAYESNLDGDHLTGEAALRFSHPIGMNTHLQVGLEGLFSDRSLFELPDLFTPFKDAGVDPRSQFSGFSLNATFNHLEDSYRGWKTDLKASLFDYTLDAFEPLLDSGAEQQDVQVSYTRQWPGSKMLDVVSAQVDVGFRQLSAKESGAPMGAPIGAVASNTETQQTGWIRAKAGLDRFIGYKTDLRLSAALVLLNYQNGVTVLPEVAATVSHPIHPWVSVNGGFRSSVSAFDLRESLARNPWLRTDREFHHRLDAELFGEVAVRLLTKTSFRLGTRAEGVHNYELYGRDYPVTTRPDYQGYYTLSYDQVGLITLYSSLTQPLFRDQFEGSVEVEYKTKDLVNDRSIPYEEEFSVSGSLSASLFDKGHLSLTSRYIGERESGDGAVLSPFFYLSVKGQVELGDRFELWLRVDNLLNEEIQVWDGVIERPFELFSGISYSF